MSNKDDRPMVFVPMLKQYEDRMEAIRKIARSLGYAIAVHGSGQRDLDLIAVPWIEQAAASEVLVQAIIQAVGGMMREYDGLDRNPTHLPHGRMSWSIQIGGGRFIDLAVMPLAGSDVVQCFTAKLDVPPLGVTDITATGPAVHISPPKDTFVIRSEMLESGSIIVAFGKKL